MDYSLNVNGHLLSLEKPLVMGILNATPDSFFAGSRRQTEADIALRARQIVSQGGSIVDVGAFSTRPGATDVSEHDELTRMRLALSAVRREVPDAVVSVDTFRPSVAKMAVEEFGAAIINDISGGNAFVSSLRVPYILMSQQPAIEPMLLEFARKVQLMRAEGQKDIILDPGFGFGKTLQQNYDVLRQMDRLTVMQLPLLVGISRKSMIYKLLGTSPDDALTGTIALNALALQNGADILRVHDVREAVETVAVVEELRGRHDCNDRPESGRNNQNTEDNAF